MIRLWDEMLRAESIAVSQCHLRFDVSIRLDGEAGENVVADVPKS